MYENHSPSKCPCGTSGAKNVSSFVGNDYYCESGNSDSYYKNGKFYPNDPLWDGSVEKPCCNRSRHPWFQIHLGYSTLTRLKCHVVHLKSDCQSQFYDCKGINNEYKLS